MFILFGIVFLAIGLLACIAPGTVYELTQGWKNDSNSEPSRLYCLNLRVGGALLMLAGAGLCVVQFFV